MKIGSEILDGLVPQNLDAEKGVIGAILLDPKLLSRVADIIAPSDFYALANAILFRTLVALDASRVPTDATTLLERLRTDGDLKEIGGAAYVAEVLHSVPYASNAEYHARIVKDLALLRGVIHATTETLREAYEPTDSPQGVLDRAEQRLQALGKGRGDELATAAQLATEVGDHIDDVAERGRHLGLATGFAGFDETIGGLFPGELTILAARPSVGKSALAAQIADYAANKGTLTYFASLEMTGRELAMRSICSISDVNSRAIRTNRLTGEDRTRLSNGMVQFARRKLVVDCRSCLTVEALARTIRRLAADGLSLAVVDYLQLLTPSDQRQKRYEQVSYQTRCLKLLAREAQIPLMVLCQLNRQSVEGDRVPQLHHLRESGSIEQDADVVLFIHRPEGGFVIPNPDKSEGAPKVTKADYAADLIIAKNRTGPVGLVHLDWKPKYTRFACWNARRLLEEEHPGSGRKEMDF